MSITNADFFSTPLLNGMLAQVVQLVRFGDGLPIIYGEKGMGKSAVALEVSARLASDGTVVCVDCREYASDFAVFLSYLLEQLGYLDGHSSSAGEGLSHLRNYSRLLLKNEQLAVLVLDGADLLDDMSLAALLSLMQGQDSGGSGLRFVFTGKAELVDRIDQLDIVDIGIYDFELSHFSPIEAEDFIAFMAQKHGLTLSKESAASLWSASKGNPSKILSLIGAGGITQEHNMTAAEPVQARYFQLKNLPVWHVLTVIVLIGALILVVLLSKEPESKAVEVEIINLPNKPLSAHTQKTTSNDDLLEDSIPPIVKDLEPVIKNLDSSIKPVQKTQSLDEVILPVKGDKLIEKADASGSLQLTLDRSVSESSQKNLLKPVEVGNKQAINEPDHALSQQNLPNDSLQLLLEKSRVFIARQSKASFTLQLLALSNPDALMQYVKRQPNKNQLYVIKAKRGNSMLYIVITGVFPTKQSALKAVNDLPLVQRQAKPWPRQFSLMQDEIK